MSDERKEFEDVIGWSAIIGCAAVYIGVGIMFGPAYGFILFGITLMIFATAFWLVYRNTWHKKT